MPTVEDGGGNQLFAGFNVPDAPFGDGADRIEGPADVGLFVVAGVVVDLGDVDAGGLQGGLGGGFVA